MIDIEEGHAGVIVTKVLIRLEEAGVGVWVREGRSVSLSERKWVESLQEILCFST